MKNKKVPMRRCIGCMESKPQSELIRISLLDGELKVDRNGKSDGRGSYICRSAKCMEKAIKKRAFNRTYKREFPEDMLENVLREIEQIKGEIADDEK